MCIQNPSKHLRWSFMVKKVNNWKPLAIYSKKLFDSLTIIMELSSTITDSHNRTVGSVEISNDTFCHFELQTGAHLEPSGTSTMEFFAKIVNN